jgi:hypothetical protein
MAKSKFFEASKRYYRHLPSAEDMSLLLLKGHLLVEELLRQLVDNALVRPAALKDARLETYQFICLAEALFHDRAPNWLWDALRKLNSIRNKLAHELEPMGLNDKIADFQQYVEQHRNKAPGLRSGAKGHPVKLALGDVHVELLILLYPHDETDA